MTAFYFFTNSAALQPQTPQQKYGPVAGNEALQYRVTSLFSSPTVQKAYAVCNGKVFAQEVNGRINLVLKPTEQSTGIFAPVKYYIYKGMMKDFLVDSNAPNNIASSTKSDLTTTIQKSQDQRNDAFDKLMHKAVGTTTKAPEISAVGLNLTATAASPATLLDTALIDDVFLRINDDEFPSVTGGDDIGQFEYADFGFEIVLDGLGEGPTIQTLRTPATVIAVSPASAGDVAKFKEDDSRERILNYIDPCAFYSALFFNGLQVKSDSSDAEFSTVKGDALYSTVLARFGTSNTVYLDLRNEHNHGLNYYNNYGANAGAPAQFYMELNGGGSAIHDYQSNDWPIFTIATTAFAGGNAKKPSTLSLRLPCGDNPSPMILRGQGYFYTGFRRMNQVPDVSEVLRPFIPLQDDNFTAPIAFSIPKISGNTTVPAYINIRYIKRIVPVTAQAPPVGSRTLPAQHFVDNLFELTSLLADSGPKIPLNTNDITRWRVTGNTAVVDPSSHYGPAYVANIGVGEDQSVVAFFASTPPVNLVTGSTSVPGFLPILADAHNLEIGRIELLDTNGIKQSALTHNALPAGLVDTPSNPSDLNIDSQTMIMLALHRNELPALQSAVNTLEPAFDKRLALRNKTDYADGSGNVTGTEYDLFVIGYQFDTGVSVVSVNTHLKLRNERSTPRVFSTKDAAETYESLDLVARNRKSFLHSGIARGVITRLRSSPHVLKSNVVPSNLLCETQGTAYRLTVLGKTRTLADNETDDPAKSTTVNRTWYYVELLEPIVVTDIVTRTSTVLPSGMRCWASDLSIVATFETFITDLITLNEVIDTQQQSPESLVARITRLRQRTKEKGTISDQFDDIIGATATTPPDIVRLHDESNYVDGPQVAFDSIPNLSTKIQLFEDYMGVMLGNGQVIDLHHLFIGMDVMNHENADTTSFGFPLGNNIDATTWAGDIGAVPADFMSGADSKFEDYWRKNHPDASTDKRLSAFSEHYWETRAKDDDMLPDVYCHLVRKRLLQYVADNTTNRNVSALLYYFNQELATEGDRNAFQLLARYLGLDPSKPLPYIYYPTVADKMSLAIYRFARLWYFNRYKVLDMSPDDLTKVETLSQQLAARFLKWLESNR